LNPLAVLPQVVPAPRSIATVEPMMIAGDRTADGTVPYELPDGTVEQVPVRATATYRLTGLVPGERVTVRLGTNDSPNLPPIAHYTGEQLEDGVVPDATGLHPAQASGGVTVEAGGGLGQAFRFDGTGRITVPHDPQLELQNGFMVQMSVNVAEGMGDQILIEKPGEHRLSLVTQDGQIKARFAVTTPAGEVSVVSNQWVTANQWTLITGRYQSGQIAVGVGTANASVSIAGAPQSSGADVQIGDGFVGGMDEIRLYALGRTPLSRFANGEQSITFIAEGTEFETQIVSNGQLAVDQQLAAYYRLLPGEIAGPAQGAPTLSERQGAGVFTKAEVHWEDRAETATTDVGYVTAELLGFMAKFGRGVFVGSGEGDFDMTVLAGDLLGSIFLSPVSIFREFFNSADRVIRMQASGADGLTLALGVVNIAGSLVKGKAATFAKTAVVAKALANNSRASGAMARLISAETRFAAGAGGVSRIQKLVAIANVSFVAKIAVGGIIDFVGDRDDTIEHFNNVLENAENDQEVLEALATFESEGWSSRDFRSFLKAAGTPLDEDAPAQGSQPAKKWLNLARVTLHGVKMSRGVLVGAALETRATTFAARVKKYHGRQLQEIYQRARSIGRRMGQIDDDGKLIAGNKGNVHRWLSDLVHPKANIRGAAVFVMRVVDALPPSVVPTFEVSKVIKSVAGKEFKRRIDFTTPGPLGELWHEVANWNWTQRGGFPPIRPSAYAAGSREFNRAVAHWNALRDKERQFMTSIIELGPDAATRLKMTFPTGLSQAGERAMRDHFIALLKDPITRRHMVDAVLDPGSPKRYSDTVSAVAAAISNVITFK
jgi:hypothetical protein